MSWEEISVYGTEDVGGRASRQETEKECPEKICGCEGAVKKKRWEKEEEKKELKKERGRGKLRTHWRDYQLTDRGLHMVPKPSTVVHNWIPKLASNINVRQRLDLYLILFQCPAPEVSVQMNPGPPTNIVGDLCCNRLFYQKCGVLKKIYILSPKVDKMWLNGILSLRHGNSPKTLPVVVAVFFFKFQHCFYDIISSDRSVNYPLLEINSLAF